MALHNLALRIAAIEALRGRTLAGDTVIDTAGNIGDSPENRARFSIAVASLSSAATVATLVLSLTVWKRDIIEGEPDEAGNRNFFYAWLPAPLDAPAQAALDVLEHQAGEALKPVSPWGKAWGAIATDVKVESARGGDGNHAQRDIVLTVTPATSAGAWQTFRAEVTASTTLDPRMKALLTSDGGVPWTDWAVLGLDCGIAIEAAPVAEPAPAAVKAKPKSKRNPKNART